MQEIINIGNGIVLLITVIGGVASAVFFGWAGILFMSAAGDPQRQAQARQAFMGAVIGLAMVGMATVVPRIVSNIVIEPAGGPRVVTAPVGDCDLHLQNQLEVNVTVNNARRMNALIQRIQSQRDECIPDLWNPEVNNSSSSVPADTLNACYNSSNQYLKGSSSLRIPADLMTGNPAVPVKIPTRGLQGNLIVYFVENYAPTNGASCWVYFKARDQWGYGEPEA